MLTSTQQMASLMQRGTEDTFPKLLARNRRLWGAGGVALRKKRYGIWNEYTWEDCYERVAGIFRGMVGLGLDTGGKVALIGDNDPEWLWVELAVQAVGGVVVGISPKCSREETQRFLLSSRPELVVVQEQEQVDRLLGLRDNLPFIKNIIYWSEKGLRHYDDPVLMSLAELVRRGEEAPGGASGFEERLAAGNGDDVAIVLCISGKADSAGEITLTHKLLITSAETIMGMDPVRASDDYVTLMSPAWFFEQVQGFCVSLLTGRKLNFAENLETAISDFREVSPHTLTYPAPMWERLGVSIQQNVAASSRAKRILFGASLGAGWKVVSYSLQKRQPNVMIQLLYSMVDLIEFRALRDKHGLDRARVAYAAGAPVSQETILFFHAIGVNLKQIYGSPDAGVVLSDPGPGRIE